MPLGTHRQRVPLMMAVACVGMLVYAVAGAAPDDGRQLAPAACESDSGSRTTSTTSCDEKDGAAKGDKGSTSTTGKDDCRPTTSTTRKADSGSDKDDADSGGKDDKESTSTTAADSKSGDDADSKKAGSDDDVKLSAAAKDDPAPADDKDAGEDGCDGDADGSDSDGKDGDGKDDDGKDDDSKDDDSKDDGDGKGDKEPTTTTTEKKDGKGSATTTTGKGAEKDGKKPTTTTTERREREPTTSTTTQPGTAGPEAPSGGTGSGGAADPDPGATPIEPQHVDDSDEVAFGPGPNADDYEMFDPDPAEAGDGWDDLDPVGSEGDGMAVDMAEPDEPVLPLFRDFNPPTSEKASARVTRSRPSGSRVREDRVEQVAAAPVATPRSAPAPSGVTESTAVSRRLPGLQASLTKQAFPATVISTPKVFPMNHRDPLAAAALVLLLGVSRELFKVWRRRATDYWPA